MIQRFSYKPYFPVLTLFVIAVIIALLTFRQYGMGWDEQLQRAPGLMSYNYIFHGDKALFETPSDNHGAAFELTLVIIEKTLRISVPAEIYHMRHLASHLVFLLGMLCMSLLALRLTSSSVLSCVCFFMLLCMPRIYAHSFFNSKDVPFLSFMAMAIAAAHLAFLHCKHSLFLLAGFLSGYATGIRIMGVLLFLIILAFIVLNAFVFPGRGINKKRWFLGALCFGAAFCVMLYLSWPYLWPSPVSTFAESFNLMAKYKLWGGKILLQGKMLNSDEIPVSYFPIWFNITIPELWLFCGYAGAGILIARFFRAPAKFLQDNNMRGYLLCLLCFACPVVAVMLFRSVIYDDWRHLYYIYPPFVMLAILALSLLPAGAYRRLGLTACMLQAVVTGSFMIRNLSFNQVYFNSFVSHEREFLRHNYDLDYWALGSRQALEYVAAIKSDSVLTVASSNMNIVLENNLLLLHPEDAARLRITDDRENCNYLVTSFRLHPDDFPYPVTYDVKVLNSSVLTVYKVK